MYTANTARTELQAGYHHRQVAHLPDPSVDKGDWRQRKKGEKVPVKRKKSQALGTAYTFSMMMEYDTVPTPKVISSATATRV